MSHSDLCQGYIRILPRLPTSLPYTPEPQPPSFSLLLSQPQKAPAPTCWGCRCDQQDLKPPSSAQLQGKVTGPPPHSGPLFSLRMELAQPDAASPPSSETGQGPSQGLHHLQCVPAWSLLPIRHRAWLWLLWDLSSIAACQPLLLDHSVWSQLADSQVVPSGHWRRQDRLPQPCHVGLGSLKWLRGQIL